MIRFALCCCTVLALTGPALAQATHLSPQELDRLSAEREKEIAPRNWGPPPVMPKGSGVLPVHRLPVPVRCASPAHDLEPLYAAPSATSAQPGLAGHSIAVTAVQRNGWTQVLHARNSYLWIPTRDVGPYRPSFDGAPDKCAVTGVFDSGIIAFDIHR